MIIDCQPQVRRVAEENGVDVSSQIKELEQRAQQVGALNPLALHRSPERIAPLSLLDCHEAQVLRTPLHCFRNLI